MTLIPPSRRLGWLLTIYGLVGVVAAIAVLVGSIVLGYQVSRLRDAVATQRQAIISTLDSTILLLGTVTTASGNIQIALDNTSATLGQAQGLAQSAADASDAVAGFAGFTIFGQQPLAGVADAFKNVAAQSAQVADQIEKVSASLSDLSGDLQAAVPALQEIQAKTQLAKDELAAADRLDDLPGYIGIGIVLVGIYLAWLGMTALGALWLGRRMLAMTRTLRAGGRRSGRCRPRDGRHSHRRRPPWLLRLRRCRRPPRRPLRRPRSRRARWCRPLRLPRWRWPRRLRSLRPWSRRLHR